MLEQMPLTIYAALALAAFLLFVRLWTTGVLKEIPLWSAYVLHLPVACAFWAAGMWHTTRWVSAAGNAFLILCALEAVRACAFEVGHRKEWNRLARNSVAAGLLVGGVVAGLVKIPPDQPLVYFIVGAWAPATAIGVLLSAYAFQVFTTGHGAHNSRHAWNAGLMAFYCGVISLTYAFDRDWFSEENWGLVVQTLATLKVVMLGVWFWKTTPVTYPRAYTSRTA